MENTLKQILVFQTTDCVTIVDYEIDLVGHDQHLYMKQVDGYIRTEQNGKRDGCGQTKFSLVKLDPSTPVHMCMCVYLITQKYMC